MQMDLPELRLCLTELPKPLASGSTTHFVINCLKLTWAALHRSYRNLLCVCDKTQRQYLKSWG